ncbi:MAG: antitoxin [Pseudomonadota bacterium]|nr:antitoxin [Burkholderiales bacterium]MDQ3196879.1 antitoxin [Pseudomonadota bacterium]
MPRTTLALDDEVFELAKDYAKNRSLTLGKAVSDLVRRGLRARPGVREIHGLLVFELPADSPRVTPDSIKRLETDDL